MKIEKGLTNMTEIDKMDKLIAELRVMREQDEERDKEKDWEQSKKEAQMHSPSPTPYYNNYKKKSQVVRKINVNAKINYDNDQYEVGRFLTREVIMNKKYLAMEDCLTLYLYLKTYISRGVYGDKFTKSLYKDYYLNKGLLAVGPSYDTIHDDLGYSTDKIQRQLNKLDKLGIIRKEHSTVHKQRIVYVMGKRTKTGQDHFYIDDYLNRSDYDE
jgi:hypothetical protein